MKREKLGSRLGFILISAGCAIGLGNIYRFPLITGANGGGFFVLIYLAFLVLLGLPVMVCELSVGRASQRSIVTSFNVLEKPGQKWGFMRYIGLIGNYMLMMFYTIISGWMMIYFYRYLTGADIEVKDAAALGAIFGGIVTNPGLLIGVTAIVIVLGFGICALGLQKGVERITKIMMMALFVLMIGLVIYSCTLPGAKEGIKWYLLPNFQNMKEVGAFTVLSSAMGQAFFTLSVGIGSIAIFGSYINKEKRLTGEAVTIIILDTAVALMAGLIIFPACETFGINPSKNDTSAGFLFTTLSSMFNNMGPIAGRIIGTLFFLFMIFASMSTVIAVFENIVSFWIELSAMKKTSDGKDGKPMDRKLICAINIVLVLVLTLPATFGLKGIDHIVSIIKANGQPMDVIDIEDFIVSNLMLPFGSLIYVLFCTSRYGWGWKNFEKEANTGKGITLPSWIRFYMTFILPLIIFMLLVISVVTFFVPVAL